MSVYAQRLCRADMAAHDRWTADIRWKENDGSIVQKPARRGFGTQVIEQMVAQLGGQAQYDWRPEGLVCEITFPISTRSP